MNRVGGIGIGGAIAGRSAKAGAAGSGFSIADNGPAEPAAAPKTQAAQSVALSGMLALQEVATGTARDKAARRHGFALLEALTQLQKELLTGLGDGEAGITALTRLTTETPEAEDPGLAAVLDAVRLRAKIELLRRGVEIS